MGDATNANPVFLPVTTARKAVVEIPTVQKLSARFVKDETAATAIEYALIVSGMSIVAGAVVHGLGIALDDVLTRVSTSLHQDTALVCPP